MADESSMLAILLDMGYSEDLARTAIQATNHSSIDAAVHWLLSLENSPNENFPTEHASTSDGLCPVVGVPSLGLTQGGMLPLIVHPDGEESHAMVMAVNEECKMALIIAEDMHLSSSKIACQCSQASIGLYKDMIINQVPWLNAWESQGRNIVILKIDEKSKLKEIAERAMEKGLLIHLIGEDGDLEMTTKSKINVLALGGISEIVDDITHDLTIY